MISAMGSATLNDYLRVLGADPKLPELLQRCLAQEDQHQGQEHYGGFEWREVADPGLGRGLDALVGEGVLRPGHTSNRYRCYRVTDAAALRQALGLHQATSDAPAPIDPPLDIFDLIEGQEGLKKSFRLAIDATGPVHILMVGPPGTAKSLFLDELERLPNARYAIGSSTSRAGLTQFLLENPGLRWLLIDEIDKMRSWDQSALLTLMASGRVGRIQGNGREQGTMHVSVFAGANSVKTISPALLDRFVALQLPEYEEAAFRRVAAAILVKREGQDPELAQEIASRVATRTRSVRRAVDIARMAKGDRRLAAELISRLL